MSNFLSIIPNSFLCVFNKKSDPIQAEAGNSGSPIVINYKNIPTLGGILSMGINITASQNYSLILFYTNPYYSSKFFQNCLNLRLNDKPDQNTECGTLTKWWEQFRINPNENVFVLEGTIGMSGLVQLLPQGESDTIIYPYYTQGTPQW